MTENEKKVLYAFVSVYDEDYYMNFKSIANAGEIDYRLVRRTVRAMARKGLTEFGKGLWTEDGEMAGAGYRLTKKGIEARMEVHGV